MCAGKQLMELQERCNRFITMDNSNRKFLVNYSFAQQNVGANFHRRFFEN